MNDNAKTYEDGVRDGFEACRAAAVAVCREAADDSEKKIKEHWQTGNLVVADIYDSFMRAEKDLATDIAALTPESPKDRPPYPAEHRPRKECSMTDTYRVRDLEWREINGDYAESSTGYGFYCAELNEGTGDWRADYAAPFTGGKEHLDEFPTLSAAKEAANEHNRHRIAERYLEVVR